MKLSALQQSYLNRRSNNFRGSIESSGDGTVKSPASVFWLLLHGVCCLICLVLGFRFSRIVFLFPFSTSSNNLYTVPFRTAAENAVDSNPVATVENSVNRTINASPLLADSTSRVVLVESPMKPLHCQVWPQHGPRRLPSANAEFMGGKEQIGVSIVVYVDDGAPVLPRKLEWSGFVLNSKLLWNDSDDKPEWIKDLDALDGEIESPLSLLKSTSVVEPLGNCGRKVLLRWLRIETDPDQWIIDPPLDITVPSKCSPWPDAPPELPSNEKVLIGTQVEMNKHSIKTKTPRSRHSRSKRKHDIKVIGLQVSTRSEEH
ncbi:unnamed protein product [Lupinus luteus]|uniref:Glycosyltransferases n=1 Tax=Lupinus luteus TaxID=3873 RepID=A0AAV1YDC3_LUPLU